jgi:hypothetical protein
MSPEELSNDILRGSHNLLCSTRWVARQKSALSIYYLYYAHVRMPNTMATAISRYSRGRGQVSQVGPDVTGPYRQTRTTRGRYGMRPICTV